MLVDVTKTHIWRGRIVRYAPFIIWIGVIFFLSSGNGSMEETSRFIAPLLKFLFPAASADLLLTYHFYIRKLAHFTEYAVLGFLAARSFAGSAFAVLRNYYFILALAVVIGIASADEFNQSFESSRTSSVWDVALDGFGGITAVIIYFAAQKMRRKSTVI